MSKMELECKIGVSISLEAKKFYDNLNNFDKSTTVDESIRMFAKYKNLSTAMRLKVDRILNKEEWHVEWGLNVCVKYSLKRKL